MRVSFCHFELAGPRETALFSFESPAASHDTHARGTPGPRILPATTTTTTTHSSNPTPAAARHTTRLQRRAGGTLDEPLLGGDEDEDFHERATPDERGDDDDDDADDDMGSMGEGSHWLDRTPSGELGDPTTLRGDAARLASRRLTNARDRGGGDREPPRSGQTPSSYPSGSAAAPPRRPSTNPPPSPTQRPSPAQRSSPAPTPSSTRANGQIPRFPRRRGTTSSASGSSSTSTASPPSWRRRRWRCSASWEYPFAT